MAREHPDYRGNIEQLNRMFPEKEMLTVPDVMKIYGWKSANSVYTHFGQYIKLSKISKAQLARLMCH